MSHCASLRALRLLAACVLASTTVRTGQAQERVEPDPFKDGSYVVRDNAGKPLERISPDPYRSNGYVTRDYDTGEVHRNVEPDPYRSDSYQVGPAPPK
jgi:hypothetical protein